MFASLTLLLCLVAPILAAPIDPRAAGFEVSFGIAWDSGNDLPILTLPYATYRAAKYDIDDDFYTFSNIRFAAPPVGALRWQKPQPPGNLSGIQDGSEGFQCMQATPKFLEIAYPLLAGLEPMSEDCLFLDVLVPGKAARQEVANLPVLMWIFGGGYALGSKSFIIYDGRAMLKSANNNIIYVAPNYRLGAFGWLNGPTIEAEGVANVGLHDQRAALQWVQDNIALVGGDKTSVTVMGESAGAGSIMHHLIAEGGTLDPLFHRAILQSPAYEPQYDPGRLENDYIDLANATGCSVGSGLDCLRSKTTAQLDAANRQVVGTQPYGTFGFGPAVDNTYIRDLPGMELAKGNYWKGVDLVIGHNSHEGYIFAQTTYMDNANFNTLINYNYPNASGILINQIETQLYPPPGLFKKYITNYFRTSDLIGQWVISCNVRFLAKAYAGNVWTYVFAVPPGIHALDTIFTFWRSGLDIGHLQIDVNIDFLTAKNLATGFQSYLTSFVQTGDPNTMREMGGFPSTQFFPQTVVGDTLTSLNMDLLGFSVRNDQYTDATRCDFWQNNAWTGRK